MTRPQSAAAFLCEAAPVLALALWLGPQLGDYGTAWLMGAYILGSLWGHLWHEVRRGVAAKRDARAST
jgi:hypothetical protein